MRAIAAALPIVVLLYAIGIRRVSAWKASLVGLVFAIAVAALAFHMPLISVISAGLYGAAFGTFPIFWVIFWAIVLYRLTVETGQFVIIKESIGALTANRNLQALLIAFAFGAFLEGAAGFGTPVAVAAAILGGLGFPPFQAAAICLLANTAPVAFGSIAIPLVTLAATTGLPIDDLSRDVGRLCAPVSLFIPSYLILVLGGRQALKSVWPGALLCGISFAGVQFAVSNYVGPYLTDILSSIAAMLTILVLVRFWHPPGERPPLITHSRAEILRAWLPYLLLVIFILSWSLGPVKAVLERATIIIHWPFLPATAIYRMRILAEAGTACAFAAICSGLILRVGARRMVSVAADSAKQLRWPFVSIVSVLALAFIMNYSGATTTLAKVFASTGKAFPFFSAMLGWLGVFLTGSDTSANALFGNLQQVAAKDLGFSAVLMAATNSAGGVMGKMISLQSIAVAAAAAGMKGEEEPKLFRFTIKHSIFLASLIGLLSLLYAHC